MGGGDFGGGPRGDLGDAGGAGCVPVCTGTHKRLNIGGGLGVGRRESVCTDPCLGDGGCDVGGDGGGDEGGDGAGGLARITHGAGGEGGDGAGDGAGGG